MKNILNLSHKKAKAFLLSEECYQDFKLPIYFSFKNLIKEIEKKLNGKVYNDFKEDNPRNFENVNYTLLSNKDGKFAWRPLQLINPVLYISLVNLITEQKNWDELKNRFKEFQENDKIECSSLPVIPKYKKDSNKEAQIINWWKLLEQRSIELYLDYKYVIHTDISDCYGSIYTHSLAWAIHGKDFAKNNRANSHLGNAIDNHLQDMSFGQTNGIPQGSTLMDFVAEIVLGYIDLLLSNELEELKIENYRILRYRDDYRIFTNDTYKAEEIAKTLSKILSGIGLKLNVEKTVSSADIIKSALKHDKRYWISNKRKTESKQKWLLQIYFLSEKFPNSGTIQNEMNKFLNILKSSKRKDKNLSSLISIVTAISIRNPRTIPVCFTILSIFINRFKIETVKFKILEQIEQKLNEVPNSIYMMIWFQRLILKSGYSVNFDDSLCNTLNDETKMIWNIDWLGENLKNILRNNPIVNQKTVDKTKKKMSLAEMKILFKLPKYKQ